MADWEALCYFRQQRCAKEVVQLVAKSHGGQFNVDAQQFLLRHCICDSVCQVHPPSPAYLRRVLKYGIQKAEDQRMDLCEELLKQYLSCMSMATDATGGSWCFKSFSYGPALKVEEDDRVGTNLHIACSQPPDTDPKVGYRAHELITLRVSENMLEGATGCHPWEAGFLLGEFILNNPVLFSGRSILELGSGTGLVAVCLARVGARLAILTDGQQKAVENCRHNLNLNGIKHTAVDPSLLDFRKCVGVHCTTLKWEHGCQWQPDIVVGADVVYDPDAVPCLCGVVSSVLSSRHGAGSEPCQDGGQGVAYILNVVRNPATFEKFTDAAAQRGLAIEDISEELVGMHMKFQFPPCQYQQSAFVMHRLSLKH